MSRLALIDGDVVLYRCAFAAQRTIYVATTLEGELIGEYAGKRALDDAQLEKGTFNINKHIALESEEAAWYAAENTIKSILEDTNASSYILYLSGEGNYRYGLATLYPYKGNRPEKPHYYNAVKDYLIAKHSARVVHGIEADDALGINQTKETVICTIDKDLDMIAGWHYNIVNRKQYYIEPMYAHIPFYRQCLTGDITDNVVGIKGIGPKRAEALIPLDTSPEDCWEVCKEQYLKAGMPYEHLLENAQLLWIQPKQDGYFVPPS